MDFSKVNYFSENDPVSSFLFFSKKFFLISSGRSPFDCRNVPQTTPTLQLQQKHGKNP